MEVVQLLLSPYQKHQSSSVAFKNKYLACPVAVYIQLLFLKNDSQISCYYLNIIESKQLFCLAIYIYRQLF